MNQSDRIDEILQKLVNNTKGVYGHYAYDGTGTDTLTASQAKAQIEQMIVEARISEINLLKAVADRTRQPWFVPYADLENRLDELTKLEAEL